MQKEPSATIPIEPITAYIEGVEALLGISKLQFETGTYSEVEKAFFETMASKDPYEVFKLNNQMQHVVVSRLMVEAYIWGLFDIKRFPKKLAFDLSTHKLLVWAVLADGDEDLENAMIELERAVSRKFGPLGFHVDSMLIEEWENLPIPSHYKIFPLADIPIA